MKQKLLVLVNLFLVVLKDPKLNLLLNIIMMMFALTMAVSQWAIGNVPVALTLTISGVSNVSAILFWLLIWLTGAKHTPRSSNGKDMRFSLSEQEFDSPTGYSSSPPFKMVYITVFLDGSGQKIVENVFESLEDAEKHAEMSIHPERPGSYEISPREVWVYPTKQND